MYIDPVAKFIQMTRRGRTDWQSSPGFCEECEHHEVLDAAPNKITKNTVFCDRAKSSSARPENEQKTVKTRADRSSFATGAGTE